MDCGVAALAMLCDVTYEEAERVIPWRRVGVSRGTYTKQLREGGAKLGYETRSTPQDRLKPVRDLAEWKGMRRAMNQDYWYAIPNNSLVKIPHPDGLKHGSHWVVWRKGKIYDPARGVFHPSKYNTKPSSYMHFVPEGTEDCPKCGTPTEAQWSGIKCPSCGWTYCT
jgi:hypothetical protein